VTAFSHLSFLFFFERRMILSFLVSLIPARGSLSATPFRYNRGLILRSRRLRTPCIPLFPAPQSFPPTFVPLLLKKSSVLLDGTLFFFFFKFTASWLTRRLNLSGLFLFDRDTFSLAVLSPAYLVLSPQFRKLNREL